MLVGAIITKAEVSNTADIFPAKDISLIKGKISLLKMGCPLSDACDNALHAADIAFANAVTACNHYGYGSDNCTSALGVANRTADVAAEQRGPLIITKIINTPVFLRSNVNKKREDALG